MSARFNYRPVWLNAFADFRRDFRNRRTALRPEQDVNGCVGVSIMRRPALTTNPRSHSQPFSTFWAAAASARRTGHGTPRLIDFDIPSPVRDRFIAEHISECRPRRIQDGFSHLGFRHGLRIHVADHDQLVFSHEPRGLLVKVMLSAVDDLRVYSGRPPLVPRALRSGQCARISPVMTEVLDFPPIRKGGEGFEAEVNADLSGPASETILDFHAKVQIPPAPCILGKRSIANGRLLHGTAEPKPVSTPKKNDPIAINLYSVVLFKRDPPQRPLPSPSRATARLVSADDELRANGLDGVAVQPKFLASACGEPPKFVGRRSLLVVPSGCDLHIAAVIPNEINGTRHLLQILGAGCVFNTIAIGQKHV